jgi:hypothetical protein
MTRGDLVGQVGVVPLSRPTWVRMPAEYPNGPMVRFVLGG